MRPLRDEADIAYRADFPLTWAIAANRGCVCDAILALREGRRTGRNQAYMDCWHARLSDRWKYYRRMTHLREHERAEFYQRAGAARVLGQIKQAAE